jgi:hypothetical protein
MRTRQLTGYGVLAVGLTFLVVGLTSKNSSSEQPKGDDKRGSDGSNISFTPDVFANMASELANAMDKFWVDKATVHRILESLRTAADLEKLMFVFGTRSKSSYVVFSNEYNLIEWLKDSLSGSDLVRVGNVFRKFNIPF